MSTALPRLRQPEYTGENRCIPCTIANLAITAVLAVVIAFGVPAVTAVASGTAYGVAAAVGVVSVAAIYFRGYLVPGTPALTKQYFPDWLLERFDKHESPTPVEGEEVDVEGLLVESGTLEECDDVDDLCLDDEFAASWHEEIDAARDDGKGRDSLARLLEVDRDDLSFVEYGEAFAANVDGVRVGQWESEAAFLADVAAAEALSERLDDWDELPITGRSQLLGGLRLFLDECPSCGGALEFGEDTVESCCRSIDVVAVTCTECEARVFEAEYSPPGAGEGQEDVGDDAHDDHAEAV